MVIKVKKTVFRHFLNQEIPFTKIFLINEENEQIGLTSKQEALDKSQNLNLDLVCISPNANPPVCKIIDYQKYLYQLKKKSKPQKKFLCKESKVSFHISEGDLITKIKQIEKWLDGNGNTVKVNLEMQGREQEHKDLAREKCQKIIDLLHEKSAGQIKLRGEIKAQGRAYIFFLYRSNK